MADNAPAEGEVKKKRTFRKFTYRGIELKELLDLKTDELIELFKSRHRRR